MCLVAPGRCCVPLGARGLYVSDAVVGLGMQRLTDFSAFSDGQSICLFSHVAHPFFFRGVPGLSAHTLHVPVQGQDALPFFSFSISMILSAPPPPQG